MTSNPTTLRGIAQTAKRRHNNYGGRGLARIAVENQHKITATTIDAILSGKYTSRPSPATLDALAYLSGETKATVYAAAGVPYHNVSLAEQLPPGVDELDVDERQAIIEIARTLVKQSRREQQLRRTVDGLGENWGRLNTEQRDAVRRIISTMHDTKSDGWADPKPAPAHPETTDYDLAAHAAGEPSEGQQAQTLMDLEGEENQDTGDHDE